MQSGGHRTWLFSLLSDILADLLGKQTAAANSAANAASSASSAVNAPGTSAISTTSLTIGTGNQSFAMTTGKAFTVGQQVRVASTAVPTNWMDGTLTAYNSVTGAATVNVTNTNGSATVASWNIALVGAQGARGVDAITAGPIARTINVMLAVGDKGKYISYSGGTFSQTFDTSANLGNGWNCWLANNGTGNITLTPGGADLIDGLSSFIMYPNEVRLIQCDGAKLSSTVIQAFRYFSQISGTWVKPPGYNEFTKRLGGGGAGGSGGGGGGSGSATTTSGSGAGGNGASGGSSGPNAAVLVATFPAAILPATVSYVIGAGGTGGAGGLGGVAQTPGSVGSQGNSGNVGSAGGQSTLGISGSNYYMATSTSPVLTSGGGGPFGYGGNNYSAGASPSAASGAALVTFAMSGLGVATLPTSNAVNSLAPTANTAGGASIGNATNGSAGGPSNMSIVSSLVVTSTPSVAPTVIGVPGTDGVKPAKAPPSSGGAGGPGGSGSCGCGSTTNAATARGGNGAAGGDGGDGFLEIVGII
jgi:hypothetical protein